MTDDEKKLIIRLEQLDAFKTALESLFYQLPEGGIPKTDLASAVQTSLGKADTALQSSDLSTLEGKVAALEALISEDPEATTHAIDKFNEIVDFLAGITDSETLAGIVSGINNAIALKAAKLGAAFDATQPYAAGAIVTNNGKIWKFTEAHAAGAWTGEDVTEITDELLLLQADGSYKPSGKKISDFQAAGNYKTTQTAKTSPSTGSTPAKAFITTITQNANGEIEATKENVQVATPYVSAQNAGQDGLMSAQDKAKLDEVDYADNDDIAALFASE